MVEDLHSQTVRAEAMRPGRRWGEGVDSIVVLLGSKPRTIEDDFPKAEGSQPFREKTSIKAGERPTIRSLRHAVRAR